MILFWVQFGLGLGLFLCLVIAIGLLVWCKNRHRSTSVGPRQLRADPNQPEVDLEANRTTEPPQSLTTRPTISGPINNFCSALDEAESSESRGSLSEDENLYADPYEQNPFQGWTFPSSFRPVGPPPPPPPRALPKKMVKAEGTKDHAPLAP